MVTKRDRDVTNVIVPAVGEVRGWEELRSSGLLWLINAVVFHPRGFAMALCRRDGQLVGWTLVGDGSEPWQFEQEGLDELFAMAERTLASYRVRAEDVQRPPVIGYVYRPPGGEEMVLAPEDVTVVVQAAGQ